MSLQKKLVQQSLPARRRLLGWNCETRMGFICIQPRQCLPGRREMSPQVCFPSPSEFSKTQLGNSIQLHLKATPLSTHPHSACAQGFQFGPGLTTGAAEGS